MHDNKSLIFTETNITFTRSTFVNTLYIARSIPSSAACKMIWTQMDHHYSNFRDHETSFNQLISHVFLTKSLQKCTLSSSTCRRPEQHIMKIISLSSTKDFPQPLSQWSFYLELHRSVRRPSCAGTILLCRLKQYILKFG